MQTAFRWVELSLFVGRRTECQSSCDTTHNPAKLSGSASLLAVIWKQLVRKYRESLHKCGLIIIRLCLKHIPKSLHKYGEWVLTQEKLLEKNSWKREEKKITINFLKIFGPTQDNEVGLNRSCGQKLARMTKLNWEHNRLALFWSEKIDWLG